MISTYGASSSTAGTSISIADRTAPVTAIVQLVGFYA